MNCFLFIYLLAHLPRLFGKKKLHLFERLFSSPPSLTGEGTVWIHAVSVGEAKAAQPLFLALKKTNPHLFFLITTTTATGLSEAKKSLAGAGAYRLLPLDFSWSVRRWVKGLNVQFFYLIETDFWPNLLGEIQRQGGKTILVSGKMSERSFHRFLLFPRLSKKLMSLFDLICVQNKEHFHRFAPFVSDSSRLHITGNLKLDLQPVDISPTDWSQKLQLPAQTIAITCTHPSEEELLLEALSKTSCFICLAPRHPERFETVASLLQRKKIPFFRWSKLDERKGGERVLLIDAMGQLPIIYSLSRLAIVGGSYNDQIGGHNILEPPLYGLPVFFGPHMFKQVELVTHVLKAKAGKQLSLQDLPNALERFFNHPAEEAQLRKAVQSFSLSSRGVTEKTLAVLEERFRKV